MSEAIQKIVNQLTADMERWNQLQRDNRAALEALQKVCVHKYVYDGHDSHGSYEKCEWCLKEEKA